MVRIWRMASLMTLLMVTILAWSITLNVHAETVERPIVRITRGPVYLPIIPVTFQATLIELRREEHVSTSAVIVQDLQAPIRIDGTIPLWGLLTAAGLLIFSVISLSVSARAHERLDSTRFAAAEKRMDANHADMKEYIRVLWASRSAKP